ncbi:MAG: extracellular solute-binding protein [Clostridia bacterium]|nr:extracellular solute-binding protein [Clostridia bacterium]
MKTKRLIFIILFVIFAIICAVFVIKFKKKSTVEETKVVQNDSYDFLIYNTEPELQECLEKLADEYRNISGIVPAVSLKDSEMLTDFNSENTSPDIFMIKNFDELKIQTQYGNVLDFMNASEKTFQEITKNIPRVLQAQVNEINNCGIPITVCGSGFAVNQKLLASIFGEEAYKNIINDLITCSYEDFVNFVKNIKSPSVVLNNKNYNINQAAANNLEAIFSFHMESPLSKMLNNIFAMNFESASDLSGAENLSNMKDKFANWLHMLDLITSNTSIKRSSDFTSLDKNSKSRAIKEFSENKTLFLVASDKDYYDIKSCNSETASHLIFIPFKFPCEKNENKDLNTNLTVYCPYYFMINAKSQKSKMAQDFLTWIISSPVARKLFLEEANCVSYDTRDPGIIENTLSRSVISYLQSENALMPVFMGIKKIWLSSVSQQLIKKYFNTNIWNNSYYNNFDNYCIKKWGNNK